VIEADETFFVRSFKGRRGWVKGRPSEPRAARPRAWGATKRGLSGKQVPVLIAMDNAGVVYEAILPSLAGIEGALDGRIAAGSVVCSDNTAAYVKAAVKAGAEHRRVVMPNQSASANVGRSVECAEERRLTRRSVHRACHRQTSSGQSITYVDSPTVTPLSCREQ
jgi:hypothetical protein